MSKPPPAIAPITTAGEDSPRAGLVAMILIVLMGACAYVGVGPYYNGLHAPFIFDDTGAIVDSRSIKSLLPLERSLLHPDGTVIQHRPLAALSFVVNYAIGGQDPWGYRLTSLLVHLLSALVLYGLVRRTLLLDCLKERFGRSAGSLAAAAAVIWVVHPLTTDAVTCIFNRAEVMMSLFYLLTLYCLLRGEGSAHRTLWLAASAGACLAGAASKEVMASAPVTALLYDAFFLGGSARTALRRRWPYYLALAGSWIVLGGLLLIRDQSVDRTIGFEYGTTAWQYAATEFGYVCRYLGLCFWPSPLVLDYGNQVVTGLWDNWPYAAVVVILLAAVIAGLVRRKKAAVLGWCVFAILAPSSSFIPLSGQVAAEKRMYLPLAAVMVLTVLAAHWCWGKIVPRPAGKSGGSARIGPVALVAAVALTLAVATMRRNYMYLSTAAIWQGTVQEAPNNSRAHYNLGLALMQDPNSQPAALAELTRALELSPNLVSALYNRGVLLLENGQMPLAVADLGQAIALNPNNAKAFNSRGRAYFLMRNHDEEALADLTRAIALQGDFAQAFYYRGTLYQRQGKVERAVADYDRAIELVPDFAEAYRNRAACYYYRKEFDRAWADIRACRRLHGVIPEGLLRKIQEDSGRTE